LEILFKNSKRLRVLERDIDDQVAVIPQIDGYLNQLTGIINLMSDVAGPNGSLINFERRRKQWEVFRVFETYQATPFTFEYSGTVGGFLYHSNVWEKEQILSSMRSVDKPKPPDVRPELRDFHGNSAINVESIVDDSYGVSNGDDDSQVTSQIRDYMISIMNDDTEQFQVVLQSSVAALSAQLMKDLKNFKDTTEDQLAFMQRDMGISIEEQHAQRVIARVFPGANSTIWEETDLEGAVYGWQDQISIYKATVKNETWLVHVTTYLDKSNVSSALRLFRFFSGLDGSSFKQAIITSAVHEDAKAIVSSKGINLFNFAGQRI